MMAIAAVTNSPVNVVMRSKFLSIIFQILKNHSFCFSYRRGGGGFNRYDNKRPGGRRDDYQVKRSRGELVSFFVYVENLCFFSDADDSFDPVSRSGNGSDLPTESDSIYSGPLQTFKKFLTSQEDDISEEDAIKKYNEYKTEHRKHQLERFFRAHKDEEW